MSWGTSPSSWSSWCSGVGGRAGRPRGHHRADGVCVGRRGPRRDRALHITLSSGSIKLTAELTLVLVLFTDAARIRISSLRQDIGLPLRLLGIGLPLTVLLGAWPLTSLRQPGIWMVVLISACLAPTDASLAAGS